MERAQVVDLHVLLYHYLKVSVNNFLGLNLPLEMFILGSFVREFGSFYRPSAICGTPSKARSSESNARTY